MTTLYALHGFLGHPKDWDILCDLKLCTITPVDLYSISKPEDGLWRWAECFNSWVSAQKATSRILMGYSLGGRLALHALLQNPSLWQKGILISTNPGLRSQNEKEKRFNSDVKWAKRFEVEPWEVLMEDWNAQTVFAGKKNTFLHNENEFSRKQIAATLTGWSVGNQDDLSPAIHSLQMPLLWIAGALDATFTHIVNSLPLTNPLSYRWIAPQSGHRVPWEVTASFIEKIRHSVMKYDLK